MYYYISNAFVTICSVNSNTITHLEYAVEHPHYIVPANPYLNTGYPSYYFYINLIIDIYNCIILYFLLSHIININKQFDPSSRFMFNINYMNLILYLMNKYFI